MCWALSLSDDQGANNSNSNKTDFPGDAKVQLGKRNIFMCLSRHGLNWSNQFSWTLIYILLFYVKCYAWVILFDLSEDILMISMINLDIVLNGISSIIMVLLQPCFRAKSSITPYWGKAGLSRRRGGQISCVIKLFQSLFNKNN